MGCAPAKEGQPDPLADPPGTPPAEAPPSDPEPSTAPARRVELLQEVLRAQAEEQDALKAQASAAEAQVRSLGEQLLNERLKTVKLAQAKKAAEAEKRARRAVVSALEAKEEEMEALKKQFESVNSRARIAESMAVELRQELHRDRMRRRGPSVKTHSPPESPTAERARQLLEEVLAGQSDSLEQMEAELNRMAEERRERADINSKDWYRVLGVHRVGVVQSAGGRARGQAAAADEIRKAFRELARVWHPDKRKDPADDFAFKRITEAYEVLSDPLKRREYDAKQPMNRRAPQPSTESGWEASGGPGWFAGTRCGRQAD